MKPVMQLLWVLAGTAAAGFASAAPPSTDAPPRAEAPPPPSMDDPGIGGAQGAPAAPAAQAAEPPAADPLAPLPRPDARLVRDKASRATSENAQRIAASQVTTRRQGTDTVEEYRQNGRIWMIKIVPASGPTQVFLANDGSGRLVRDPNEGPISPVYYSLYEWK
jgi:hypothetical protein